MAVYLFTYHAYGSWMPDHKRGYVDRREGVQPQSVVRGEHYRRRMTDSFVSFNQDNQRKSIDIVIDSQSPQAFRAFAVATDPTHLHALVAWTDDRDELRIRAKIKSSLSRGLNGEFGRRDWLSEGGRRKRVRNRTHFDYLIETYLPGHRGMYWDLYHGFRDARK